MRLVQPPGRIAGGRILFKGRDLLDARPSARCARCAARRSRSIFQEPMTALNPVFTVGDQIAETLLVHGRATRRDATAQRDRAAATRCAFPMPASRVSDYPHQLSGGMRQRVLIAMALACRPSLVIADEPTTALDVTIQAQILDLLREMKTAFNLSLLLITHDLGVVAETADRVAVMYAGRIVETGPVRAIFREPAASRTRAACSRRCPAARPAGGCARSRAGAAARRAAARLRVQPALSGSLRAVHDRAAAGLRRRARSRRAKCYLHDPAIAPIDADRTSAVRSRPHDAAR